MQKCTVFMVCLLLSQLAYGQVPPKLVTGALAEQSASKTVADNVAAHTLENTLKRATAASLHTAEAAPTAPANTTVPNTPVQTIISKIEKVLPWSNKRIFSIRKDKRINTLSRSMTKKYLAQIWPYLFQEWTVSAPELTGLGKLIDPSPAQRQEAQTQYTDTMQTVKNLAHYADTTIYYLGSSETERLTSMRLNQILSALTIVKGQVKKTRATWGDEAQLTRAAVYLENIYNFYMTLSTGTYFPIGENNIPLIKRTDNHIFNSQEFNLNTHLSPTAIATSTGEDPQALRGALPENLRVAVLHDSEDAIEDLTAMQQKVQLTDWQFDFYEDPEAFLKNVSYKKYDLILTDIMSQNGGGRYLARQLRYDNYEGTIITLSLYQSGGKAFFDDGIDGMITLCYHGDGANWMWSHLNEYFLLKQKYGWKH